MKHLLLICLIFILNGCGIAYKPITIHDDGSGNIRVVPLTIETVMEANKSEYEPLSLPNAFFQNVRVEGQIRDLNVLPKFILEPQKFSGTIETNLPKPFQSQPYIIGVGDVVMLSTPQAGSIAEALNGILATQNRRQGYTVQDDGSLSIPDIGRLVIGGLTLQEAEGAVFRQLVEAGVAPSFSIEVVEFNSQSVAISGDVLTPGIEPITIEPLYLDHAISRKGGVTVSDPSFTVIRLYRNGSIYQLSGADLYSQDVARKILLTDGDRIVVGVTHEYDNILGSRQQARENFTRERELATEVKLNEVKSVLSQLEIGAIEREYVYIIGEVKTQSRFTLPFQHKAVLADALLNGGGVASLSGNPEQIYVLRRASDPLEYAPITALHLDSTNAANFLLATRLELRPKDVIFVGTQPVTNWNRIINQIIPSLALQDINLPSY